MKYSAVVALFIGAKAIKINQLAAPAPAVDANGNPIVAATLAAPAVGPDGRPLPGQAKDPNAITDLTRSGLAAPAPAVGANG